MKTPEEWNQQFEKVISTLKWETEDPYSERPIRNYEHVFNYELREKRLEIIKQIQDDAQKI